MDELLDVLLEALNLYYVRLWRVEERTKSAIERSGVSLKMLVSIYLLRYDNAAVLTNEMLQKGIVLSDLPVTLCV